MFWIGLLFSFFGGYFMSQGYRTNNRTNLGAGMAMFGIGLYINTIAIHL